MFSYEWNRHRIEWEIIPQTKLFRFKAKTILHVDGQLIGETTKTRLSGEFLHDGERHKIKLRTEAGLNSYFSILFIDRKKVSKQHLWYRQIPGFYKRLFVSMILSFLGVMVAALILLFCMLHFFLDVSLFVRTRELDLSEVTGTIYFADRVGNLIKYKPSTGSIDTLLKTDSMVVTGISPDRKSAIAIIPRESGENRFIERKIFWITLADRKMRLIAKKPMNRPDAFFTRDSNKIVIPGIMDTTFRRALVADSVGRMKAFDTRGLSPAPSGEKFIGYRYIQGKWNLLFWDDREPIPFDFSFEFTRTTIDFWNEETLAIVLRHEKNMLLMPIEGGNIDTMAYKLYGNYYITIVRGEKPVVLLCKYITAFLQQGAMFSEVRVYDKETFLWRTTTPSYFRKMSPDRNFFIGWTALRKKPFEFYYIIAGKENKFNEIPFDMHYRILGWFDD